MELREKTLKTDEIYKGYVIRLEVSQVECPNGNIAEREIVRHPGGVAVVAVDKDENVYMVKQYRIPYDEIILEVPAGKLDKGENPDDAAERELREETGIVAENMLQPDFPLVKRIWMRMNLFSLKKFILIS